jgi:ADP-L-glycero-D-manno-heptose 6-epimerase
MVIAVTGAYGFIGSNIISELNKRGYTDIIAVDNLSKSNKFSNLVNCEILDFVDKETFIEEILAGEYDNQIDYIIHQGACSDTTNHDGKYMMKNNYDYSYILLDYAQKNEIPFLYASSASVYGNGNVFEEVREHEAPINIYGYSKFLFDQMVRRYYETGLKAPIVGLRYFNVYGINEFHKERMASVVYHNYMQYKENGFVNLFSGYKNYANGMQMRDFISVEDVVNVNMFFFDNHMNDHEEISGIFNCGTGVARTFNDLSLATINSCLILESKTTLTLQDAIDNDIIRYIPFPQDLINRYQFHTEASIKSLKEAGYNRQFLSLEDGIFNYIKLLVK